MVDLGKSKVPLEEDLIKKPIEFVKTWVEWNAINSLQIIKFRGTAGTMYTVPEKKTLYITSAFIGTRDDSAVSGGTAAIFIGGTNDRIINISTTPVTLEGINTMNMVYPMPIKVEGGQTVEFSLSAGISSGAGFQGFEIDKRIS